jgi:FkbM family methyltransferase
LFATEADRGTEQRLSWRKEVDTVKGFVRLLLNKLGYEIHRSSSPPIFGRFHPGYLVEICQPKTVIDVGVGYGTFPLYLAFPEARFVLVEPLRDFEAAIEGIGRKYNCDVFYKAVSDRSGVQEINVDALDPQKSSLADRTALTRTGNKLEKRRIETTTLDRIYEETLPLEEPILLKIDAEGHELKALQGATSLLGVTETVIAEVSISRRFEGSYTFEDLVLFMRESGFFLSAFLSISHRAGEPRPRHADVVFQSARRVNLDG